MAFPEFLPHPTTDLFEIPISLGCLLWGAPQISVRGYWTSVDGVGLSEAESDPREEKIIAKCIPNKRLVSKICKELSKFNSENQKIQLENGQKS